MPAHADMRLIVDWQEMVREMERLVPIWEPGSKSGYHGLTFGWILVGLAPNRLGLGYTLGRDGDVMAGSPQVFGYSGLGGMIGYADQSSGLAVAVLCNRMKSGRGKRSADYVVAEMIREELGCNAR